MRPFLFLTGLVATGLGIAGIVLPLLPATPFFLLAAFAFARSSPRFHGWLINHRRIGPAIQDWQRDGAIRPKAKMLAMVALVVTFGISLAYGLNGWLLALQAGILVAVACFILTRPSVRGVSSGLDADLPRASRED